MTMNAHKKARASQQMGELAGVWSLQQLQRQHTLRLQSQAQLQSRAYKQAAGDNLHSRQLIANQKRRAYHQFELAQTQKGASCHPIPCCE
jgi:hypothetical protein